MTKYYQIIAIFEEISLKIKFRLKIGALGLSFDDQWKI